MSQTSAFQDISKLEDTLWEAADQLRANSKLTSSEYCMPILGIIFLRHATNRYNAAVAQIEADRAAGKMAKRPLIQADFLKRRALMLPQAARYDQILKLSKGTNLELWHFDKGKPKERRDQVLMMDARNIYRKVTRKIYDFTPEQQQNLAAIVWLYRGQTDRFIALVQQHLDRTLAEAAAIAGKSAAFRTAYVALTDAAAPFLKTLAKDSPLRELLRERDDSAKSCFAALDKWTGRIAKEWTKPCDAKLATQQKLLGELEALAAACRDLVKDLDIVFKLATRLVDAAEKDASAKDHETWDGRAIGRLEKDFDARRKEAVEQLKAAAYFERQAHWLLSRFPDAKLVAVPGLVKLVDRKEIEAADWSLTPGRYVGVAPPEVDEDFDFEQTLGDIHVELADLNQEAAALAKKIQKNFEGLL